jgi:hypothetical protein
MKSRKSAQNGIANFASKSPRVVTFLANTILSGVFDPKKLPERRLNALEAGFELGEDAAAIGVGAGELSIK